MTWFDQLTNRIKSIAVTVVLNDVVIKAVAAAVVIAIVL